jgi:tungstate transport system permease protein
MRRSVLCVRRPFPGRRFFVAWFLTASLFRDAVFCAPLVQIERRRTISEFLQGLAQAVHLIVTGNPSLLEIVVLSLRVSGTALLFSTLVGIPLGAALGLSRFVGRRLVIALLYTGMGLPPVVVGLFVYLILSRTGPLGSLEWPLVPSLFTPAAMVVAQSVISFPLVAGFTMAAVMGVPPRLHQQIQALGATRWQAALTVLTEARVGVVVSVIAGFGSIISEVGAVMMVGGNIEGRTRVLTTAIVLETRKGNFDLALALGAILLGLSFLTNAAMLGLQGRTSDE